MGTEKKYAKYRCARITCRYCQRSISGSYIRTHHRKEHSDQEFPDEQYAAEFFDQYWVEVESGCHEWVHDMAKGYGYFKWNYRRIRAHRWNYERHHGPIPRELVVDHLCRNPKCVNPGHLEAVTVKVNTLRGIGPSSINSRKTHCPAGHPYSVYAYYRPDGKGKNCTECVRRSSLEYQRRKRVKKK